MSRRVQGAGSSPASPAKLRKRLRKLDADIGKRERDLKECFFYPGEKLRILGDIVELDAKRMEVRLQLKGYETKERGD